MNSEFGSHRPFTVVLTGGIASGKSTVSRHFEKLGIPVIDTDIIARELVEPGQPALKLIAKSFGPEILQPNGTLDRKKMRETIFSDPDARKKLESILHPLIRKEAERQATRVNGPYCVLVIPLYSQASSYKNVNRVLVVDVSEETQLRRIMKRDGSSRELARRIIKTQPTRTRRLALADDIIQNESEHCDLELDVKILHQKYVKLAQKDQNV